MPVNSRGVVAVVLAAVVSGCVVAPSLAWDTPKTDAIAGDALHVKLTVTGQPTKIVIVLANTAGSVEVATEAPWDFNLNTNKLVQGDYTIQAKATFTDKDMKETVLETPVLKMKVDHTAPTIKVSAFTLGKPIDVSFSEPMAIPDAQALALQPIQINQLINSFGMHDMMFVDTGTEIPCTTTWNDAHTVLSITPSAQLLPPSRLVLEGITSLTDVAGNAVGGLNPEVPFPAVKETSPTPLGLVSHAPTIMQMNKLGHPVLAWLDNTSNYSNVRVMMFNGDVWVEGDAGPLNGNVQIEGSISMVIDADNNPYVAFSWLPTIAADNYDLVVFHWNGTLFVPVGGSIDSIPARNGESPILALDSTGNPWVLFSEYKVVGTSQLDLQTSLRKWNGTAWVDAAPPIQNRGKPSGGFVFDATGAPVIAQVHTVNGSGVVDVSRFDGTAWQQVATTIGGFAGTATGADVVGCQLTFDTKHGLILSYQALATGPARETTEFVRLDANVWTPVFAPTARSMTDHIHFDSKDHPTVFTNLLIDVTVGNDRVKVPVVYMKQFDGSAWVTPDGLNQPQILKGTSASAVAEDAAGHFFISTIDATQQGFFGGDLNVRTLTH